MVWGAFQSNQKNTLVKMDKNRRTAIDFVDQVYEGELEMFWANIGAGILMEDGAPIHRSNAPKEWWKERAILKLVWPANSPDLNPIEHVWAKMKADIVKLPKAKNEEEMWAQLQKSWSNIDGNWLQSLVDSMPDRMAAVIAAKGGSTRW
jgi:hypothetical protein